MEDEAAQPECDAQPADDGDEAARPPAPAAGDTPEAAAVLAGLGARPADGDAGHLASQEEQRSTERNVLLGAKLPDGWSDLSVQQRVFLHHPPVKV